MAALAHSSSTLGSNTVAALTAGTPPHIFEKCSLALLSLCRLLPRTLSSVRGRCLGVSGS
eukprot:8172716-Lingulodinium_polyedra.AAC.1